MTRIWRVEHPVRNMGPYTAGLLFKLKTCPERNPSPKNDIHAWRDRSPQIVHRFGFINIKQLYDWFEQDLELLEAENYMISAYDVPHEDILMGDKQIAYLPQCASRVDSISFNHAKYTEQIAAL